MKIVFFDGYCSLCNTFVDWLIRVDASGELTFASLQGETAKRLLDVTGDPIDLDTVVYLRDADTFVRSTAVIQILSDIGGAWAFVKVLLLVPKPVRDFIYRRVAKNRYRFFKRRETCRLPTENEKSRILP